MRRLKIIFWNRVPALRKFVRRSFSQWGQDRWVIDEMFFGARDRYFVELGAYNGLTDSNSFLLETAYGWSGICIEPDPEVFARLQQYRRCRLLNCCADAQEQSVDFVADLTDGGIREYLESERLTDGKQTIRVQAYSLASLLDREDAPEVIDYLSLDVEGAEDSVMLGFPFDRYRFNVMTIERPSKALQAKLSSEGYVLLKITPGVDFHYAHLKHLDWMAGRMRKDGVSAGQWRSFSAQAEKAAAEPGVWGY